MLALTFVAAIAAGTVPALALQASTSHYSQGSLTACGCNPAAGTYSGTSNGADGIAYITAAGNQALFDTAEGSWCGNGCGKCYNATGTNAPGTQSDAGQNVIILVNNYCPPTSANPSCPDLGKTNPEGFLYHFDILNDGPLFGDNIVVDFEEMACPAAIASVYSSCECKAGSSSGSLPGGSSAAAGPSAAGPSAAGPSAAGPSAAGPSAAGPSAAGPSAGGSKTGVVAAANLAVSASNAPASASGVAVSGVSAPPAGASLSTVYFTTSGNCGGDPRPSGSFPGGRRPRPSGSFSGEGGTRPSGSFSGRGGPRPSESFQGGCPQPSESFQGGSASLPSQSFQGGSAPLPSQSFQGGSAPLPSQSFSA